MLKYLRSPIKAFNGSAGCGRRCFSNIQKLLTLFYSASKLVTLKMSISTDVYYEVSLDLTKKAGALINEKFFENKIVEEKSGDIDLVTETDKEVEKLLISGLTSHFPSHKFIGEESIAAGIECKLTDDPTWIIDPVDGTLNFVHGFPQSCVSVGLFIDKKPEIGIIYNPITEQLFTAQRGKGAYLNGKQIKTSGCSDLSQAIVMLENGTSRDPERYDVLIKNNNTLVPLIHGIRSLGSAALDMAMVAMGGADAYFEFGIHIWDMAAGELLVTEAGGVVIDPAGGPLDHMSRRVLCASTQAVADQLTQRLVQFYPQPRD